jgi:hypothetical protein
MDPGLVAARLQAGILRANPRAKSPTRRRTTTPNSCKGFVTRNTAPSGPREHENVIELRHVFDKPHDSRRLSLRFVFRDRSSCTARVLANAKYRFRLAGYRCFPLGSDIWSR